MAELSDLARHKWRSILPALGVAANFLSGKHGPCPICGGRDRFRFDDKDGRGTWFCNACRAGDGISLLVRVNRWTFREVADRIRPLLGEAVERRSPAPVGGDPIEACRLLWLRGRKIDPGDMVSAYLAGRGLEAPASADLRFLPDCHVTGVSGRQAMPAMLALVRDPNGEGASVHRTYLDGAAKAGIDSPRRLMPGALPRGVAIRLCPHDGVLGVAEGIETALAVTRDFGLPCWATLNATIMREFEWPPGLRELHVFGDNDGKFAGQAAAYQLAMRASTAPQPVATEVHVPPERGTDWLDHGNAAQVRNAA